MKYLISVFLFLSVTACSTQVDDMTPESTVQTLDLIDSEGDGVINARDQCSESSNGAQVDNKGCGTENIVKVRHNLLVNFAKNSYIVDPQFLPEIAGLADFMKTYPETKVTIEGHTSKLGSKVLNKALSQHRAQAIKDILVNKFALAGNRITPMGYGFERLLAEGDGEYSHARNRRIVAELSSEQSFPDMKWTIYSVDQRSE